MPARTFDRGIEEMEKTERQNISSQGMGAIPYGMSEPVFNFPGQVPGQSFPGAYGQVGQQQPNPYLQSQPWSPYGAIAGQQPWSVFGQNIPQTWPVYGQQQFVPNVPLQYGQTIGQQFPPFFGQAIPPSIAGLTDPFISRQLAQTVSPFGAYGQQSQIPYTSFSHPYSAFANPYAQLAQQYGQSAQPFNVFGQQPFTPFGQTALHPFAQQPQLNPFLQQAFQQQPMSHIGQQFANPFGQLGVYAGVGQSQQQLPFNVPISQQVPGIYGQQLASSIPVNPLFQSPLSQLTSPFAQFGMQTPWGASAQTPFPSIIPQTGAGFGRFGQIPERQAFGQGGRGFQSQAMSRAPKGYKRADDRIKDDITERLMMYPEIDLSDVEILVKDGEVTLRGSIEDRNVKRIAEDVAESIFGVRDVLNELRVAPKFQQPGTKEREPELTGAARGKEK